MPTQTQTFYSYEAYTDAIQNANLRTMFLEKKHANWVLIGVACNLEVGCHCVDDGSALFCLPYLIRGSRACTL